MNSFPLMKYMFCFISGILLSHFQVLNNHAAVFIFLFSLLLILLILIFRLKRSQLSFKSTALNIVLFFHVISLGASYHLLYKKEVLVYPFEKQRINHAVVFGEVHSMQLINNGDFEFQINLDSVSADGEILRVKTNILAKIKNENKGEHTLYSNLKNGNRISAVGRLQKAREQRNPFEYDYNNYLNENGIAALFYIKSHNDVHVIDDRFDFSADIIFTTRNAVNNFLTANMNKETSALLKGLLLADRSGIDYDTKESFVNSGVIHVLAVSGLHVGFIVIIFFSLFQRFNIYLRNILTMIGLLFFVLLTDAPASVVRASIMACVLLAANLMGRNYFSLNGLALAAFVILIINPSELFNPGFQLSFSAVFSIITIYPVFKNIISSIDFKSSALKSILLFVSVSLAAQIGTLPFTLAYFHKLSVISLFSNLIVIPLIGIIVACGAALIMIGILLPYISYFFVLVLEILTRILFEFVLITGSEYYSHFYISQFTLYDAAVFYLLLTVLFLCWKYMSAMSSKIILTALLVANFIILSKLDNRQLLPENKFSLLMIDVGQGDSFLLKFPNGKTALIDAGNALHGFDNGERVIYPLLNNLDVDRLNYCFISHLDADHFKGAEFLIQKGIIDTIFKPARYAGVSKDVEFENMIRANGVQLKYYSKEMMSIGEVRIYFLNDTNAVGYANLDLNNKSGIIKIQHGSNSFLFVGDAEYKAERILIDSFPDFLKVDVLKVGHHGSKTGTTASFLDLVNPKISLISSGLFNQFKHPSAAVIERLQSYGAHVLRTDLNGAALLVSNGDTIEEINWREF